MRAGSLPIVAKGGEDASTVAGGQKFFEIGVGRVFRWLAKRGARFVGRNS